MSRAKFCLCLVVCCIAFFCWTPSTFQATSFDLPSKRDNESDPCGFEGNPDIYGIGIRIGLYAQLVAVWLGTDIIRQERSELNSARQLFMSAMLIALLVLSAKREAYVVEAFIILQLLYSYSLAGPQFDQARSQYLGHRTGFESEIFDRFLLAFVSVYNIWFWWKDIDRLKPTSCGTYALVYVWKFDLYGTIREVMKALSIFNLILISRDLVFDCLGLFMMISYRKMFSKEIHDAVKAEAEAQNRRLCARALSTTFFEQGSHTSLNSTPVTKVLCTSRRWSTSVIYQTSSKSIYVADHPVSPHREHRNQSSTHSSDRLNSILEADYFISEVTACLKEDCERLSYHRIQLMGFNFALLGAQAIVMAYYQEARSIVLLIWQHPQRIRLLIAMVRVLKVEGRIKVGLDRTIAPSTLLKQSAFYKIDIENAHLAAQLRATRAHAGNPQKRAIGSALIGLLLVIGTITAVELTMVWNNVTEIQQLASIGQLVAFIVGVGGLLRILYAEGKYIHRHGEPSLKTRARTRIVPPSWADAYYEWKDCYERVLLMRKPTAFSNSTASSTSLSP